MKRLIFCLATLSCVVVLGVSGCVVAGGTPKVPVLSIVRPETQELLKNIPRARYEFQAVNPDTEAKETLQFEWPLYVAIGNVRNETGAYETAAAGQVNYSTILGMATRKYYIDSVSRAPALRGASRDDREEIRRILMEVGGEGNILAKLTPLTEELVNHQVWKQLIPPEFYISGALTEVSIADKSVAGGLSFAGVGVSGKIVETSVSGSIEITDIYTGEMLGSVIGQNRVVAHQVGVDTFRIVSAFGLSNQYLNAEAIFSQELIKQKVQAELVDYLYYTAFTELLRERPEILTNRLHFRVGRIHSRAMEIARQKGLELVNNSVRPLEPRIVKVGVGAAVADGNGVDLRDFSEEFRLMALQ